VSVLQSRTGRRSPGRVETSQEAGDRSGQILGGEGVGMVRLSGERDETRSGHRLVEASGHVDEPPLLTPRG